MIDYLNNSPLPAKSAMTPILWLVGIIAAGLIPATPFLPVWAAIIGWALLVLIVAAALWSYIFLIKNDRGALRSEDHSLKIAALHLHNKAPGSGDHIAQIIAAPTMSAQKFLSKGPSDER